MGAEKNGSAGVALFDHERLEVYRTARELLLIVTEVLGAATGKIPRELRDQLERSSMSILFNIGEGAGKYARAEKQRFYEIARGSTLEAATQLDVMQIRGFVAKNKYDDARALLLRIAAMLSRMCKGPRSS